MSKFKLVFSTAFAIIFIGILSCRKENTSTEGQAIISKTFGGKINLDNLANYANQSIPNYITKDNTNGNIITNAGATLGRVLFYDKNLSADNSLSCSSCHKQAFAFSDTTRASQGVNGTTGRHAMRLINARFAREVHFFWDERATTLEDQTTQPIQNHNEMGYSGEDGDPTIQELISKLESIDYYPVLFINAFGDEQITEARMQDALAQFVRSIQSFDSKYDEGRAQAPNDGAPFSNFTQQENQGKELFIAPPQFDNNGSRINGGLGCSGCHQPPEFDIDPNSGNNGVIGTVDDNGTDFTVTRSPSLRDVVKEDGTANGPFMHIGLSINFMTVLNHYDQIKPGGNPNLDPKLIPGGNAQNLNMTQQEKNALFAFIKTLAGHNVYTEEKWSDPFK